VTGASRGIGECFARELALRSWNLVLVARTRDKLEQLASELAAAHDIRVETICADLAAEGAAAEIAGVVDERGLGIELLVNNAGSGDHGEVSKMSAEAQADTIRLNALTLVELTRRMLPGMLAARVGGIVNVSSTAGFQPMPFFAVYAASKAFVTSFSLALAEELRGSGVRVVTLCPGPTRAPSHEDVVSKSRIRFDRQPADEVVKAALNLAEHKGGLLVPRAINKAMSFSTRLMPLPLTARLAGRAMRPRDS
jgi:short-subunit dehydrogenase